ncbi:MAG: CBS domain-containing protein [Candidatus Micrarchaeota archaeon]
MRIAEAATIPADESISKAFSMLSRADYIVVVDADGRYAGELSAPEFGKFTPNEGKTKAASRARKGAVISGGKIDSGHILRLFAENRLEGLPVLDSNRRVVGVVDRGCVLEEACSLPLAQGMRALEAAEAVSSIAAGDTASQATGLMLRSGAREIVVTEGSKAVGTVSVLDIARKVKPHMRLPFRTATESGREGAGKERVESVMSQLADESVIGAGTSLAEAARRMLSNGGRMLLVYDGGKIRGAVTFHGLLKAIVSQQPAAGPSKAVVVTGLKEDERAMRKSVEAECTKAISRMRGDAVLHLRVRSIERSNGRKEYEVRTVLEVGGRRLHGSTPDIRGHRENWDLHLAVKEVLADLRKQYEKQVKNA